MSDDDQLSVDDLLGVESLPLDPSPTETKSPRRRKLPSRGIFFVVGAVLFFAMWYVSSLHHERFYLVVDNDQIVVKRGWYFPMGRGAYEPSRAYKPFRVPPSITPESMGPMSAKALDEALLKLFRRVAERELQDMEHGNAAYAEDMLLRVPKLFHVGIEDERKLLQMLGDVHFHQGVKTLRDVQKSFDAALREFELAAMRGGKKGDEAAEWVRAIKRFRHEFGLLSQASGLDPNQFLDRKKKRKKTPPKVKVDPKKPTQTKAPKVKVKTTPSTSPQSTGSKAPTK